jgi:hypothetical protein
VHVIAQATDTQQVTSLHVSVDGIKKFQANANSLDTRISMSSGVHRITVVAKDASGYYWKTIDITVQ